MFWATKVFMQCKKIISLLFALKYANFDVLKSSVCSNHIKISVLTVHILHYESFTSHK